jgi:CBS domain-containing protein
MSVNSILDSKGNDITTVEPTTDIASAVSLLAARNIGALIVVDSNQQVAGIISERDVVREVADHGVEALRRSVGDVMTRKVVTCSRVDTIGTAMELMTAGRFRHLPVIEQGQLVGVISIGDVIKHRLHEIETESATLRDYIRNT